MADLLVGRLQWTASEPLVVPAERPDDHCYSIKDPSVVFYQGRLHLFFTTLDGRMWREETSLEDFPTGYSEATLAIKGDIFEASHTYRIKRANRYLTIVEAQDGHG